MDDEEKMDICTECNFRCKKSKMLFHMARNHDKDCYVCTKCTNNEFFESRRLLSQHDIDCHSDVSIESKKNSIISRKISRHFEIKEDKKCNIKLSNLMEIKKEIDSVSLQTSSFSCEFTMQGTEPEFSDRHRNYLKQIFCGICDVNESPTLTSDADWTVDTSHKDNINSETSSVASFESDVSYDRKKHVFSQGEDAIIFDTQYIWLYNVRIVRSQKDFLTNSIQYLITYKGYSDQYNTIVSNDNLFKASDALDLKNRLDQLDNFKMDVSTKYYYETLEEKTKAEDKFELEEKVFVYYKRLLYHGVVLAIKNDPKIKAGTNFMYKVHFEGWSNEWDEWVPLKRLFKLSETTDCIAHKQWLQVELREQSKGFAKAESKKRSDERKDTVSKRNKVNKKCRVLIEYVEERSEEVWAQCACGQWYHKSCTGLEKHSNFDYDTFSCLFVGRSCNS